MTKGNGGVLLIAELLPYSFKVRETARDAIQKRQCVHKIHQS